VSAAPIQHPDFESEQAFLRHAYATLEAIKARGLPNPEAGADPKAMAALRMMFEQAQERFDDGSVCFGRIDEKAGDAFYIGANLIWEKPGVGLPLVISWASDQATPFYKATPAAPLGLSLRRRFRTERDRLLGISDEPFGIAPGQEPTIGDFLLEELGRNRTSEMRQVAATIQAEQYEIIARPALSTTIVQGGPGTGKTVVGLHRAALLLYRERERSGAQRVLIVGPNRLFMQYIQSVLPSLGETAAEQRAVSALGPISSSAHADPLVARVKGDLRMAEVLRRAVADRVRPPEGPTRFRHDGVRFEISPDRVSELVGEFDPAVEAYNVARDRFRNAFERMVMDEYAAAARRAGRMPLQLRTRDLPELERARDRIWPTFTAPELLRQLLSSEERLERAAEEVLTDPERRLLYTKPVERLEQVEWTISDVPLADEVQYLLDHRPQRYWHVVLDEAQDLTPMELRMVGRRIRDGAVTVLGDLAQATGLWKYSAWSEIASHLGHPEGFEIEELTLAYRVPKEIMDVALPVLELTAPSIRPPVAFRSGDEPTWHEVSPTDLVREVIARASGHSVEDGTVAIIAPPGLLSKLRDELRTRQLDFGDGERGELAASIELLDPAMSKGLEFDHVYLVEPNMITREGHEDRRFQELYVSLTRATRTLTCVFSESPQWPLALAVRDGSPPPMVVVPLAPEPVSVEPSSGPEPAAVGLSLDEAVVLTQRRGIDLREAFARALLAAASGADEATIAVAILDADREDADVQTLLSKADELGRA
jgi:DNA helicase IV